MLKKARSVWPVSVIKWISERSDMNEVLLAALSAACSFS
jgi:hypothetical protein